MSKSVLCARRKRSSYYEKTEAEPFRRLNGALAFSAVMLSLFVLLLSFACVPASAAYSKNYSLKERIVRFNVTAVVNEDASLTVREDLVFVAAGVKISRGIIRAIPVRYTAENGRTVTVGLEVLSTSVDGKELSWKESEKGRGRYIRIGDVNSVLSPGIHTLSLTYRTTKQLGFYDGYDELYWNVTGNDWDMPIENASFALSLPGYAQGEGFNAVEWYTGYYGSTSSDAAEVDSANAVHTTRSLSAGEGLTVVYTWPKGIVMEPEASLKEVVIDLIYGYADSICSGLVYTGMVLAVIFLIFAYLQSRGGNRQHTVIPLFHAPEGMTPALARYVTAAKTDTKSLSAELIAMAIDGVIKIHGSKKEGYSLEKCEKNAESEPHSSLCRIMFPEGSIVKLTKDKSEILRNARSYLDAETEMRAGIITEDRRGTLRFAYLSMLACAAASAALALITEAVSDDTVFSSILLAFLSLVCILNLSRNIVAKDRGPVKAVISAVGPLLPVMMFIAVVGVQTGSLAKFVPYAALALAGLPLKKRLLLWTEDGARLRAQADGLEMFITAAEKNRLEMLNPPDDTPALFEELLPYAVALDCADTWADRFEDVLAAAEYKPEWCDMPARAGLMMGMGRGLGFAGMAGSFADSFSSSLASASTPPGSHSGFSGAGGGGGGFSGGGGGGGGGRGW